MKTETKGWAVVNYNHPRGGLPSISDGTFRRTRTESIKKFIKDSGSPWEYWRRKYNFRCVKCILTIETIEP